MFPQQLKYVSEFKPARLFFNVYSSLYGSPQDFESVDKSDFIKFDLGIYYPGKGLSNSEIAAASRSQHRCQGMGTAPIKRESK